MRQRQLYTLSSVRVRENSPLYVDFVTKRLSTHWRSELVSSKILWRLCILSLQIFSVCWHVSVQVLQGRLVAVPTTESSSPHMPSRLSYKAFSCNRKPGDSAVILTTSSREHNWSCSCVLGDFTSVFRTNHEFLRTQMIMPLKEGLFHELNSAVIRSTSFWEHNWSRSRLHGWYEWLGF
jgi:hypothetical protein